MEIRKRYECYVASPGITFVEPSLTQQQFADDTDINVLVDRYEDTGFFYDPLSVINGKSASSSPTFGDFSEFDSADYMRSQNVLVKARESFENLPVEIRERFNYNPLNLLEFISDKANYEEALKLGLVNERMKEDVSRTVEGYKEVDNDASSSSVDDA